MQKKNALKIKKQKTPHWLNCTAVGSPWRNYFYWNILFGDKVKLDFLWCKCLMKVANERLVLFSSSYFRCIMTIATFYRLPDIKTLAYIILQNFLRSIYVRRDIFSCPMSLKFPKNWIKFRKLYFFSALQLFKVFNY